MDPANIMARLLHRDASVLVLDKPAGLPVHRDGRGRAQPTITDWLDVLRFGLPRRPELAHRLDRDTSGCLVLGRHPRALARLSALFAAGAVAKTYWAVVDGVPDAQEGRIALPLSRRSSDPRDWRMRVDENGREAVTEWSLLGVSGGRSWLRLRPLTGRTHQLRIHCAASGWPIVGDVVYGRAAGGLMLHARSVEIPYDPRKPPILAEAPPPPAFASEVGRWLAERSQEKGKSETIG